MKIERTHDMELVKRIMSDPRIWPHIHEDGIDEPNPLDHDELYWMLISDEEGPAGVFLTHKTGVACWEMHTCLLPRIWGEGAAKAAKLLGDYLFYEADCLKLITRVPAYNTRAKRYAEQGGMRVEGINRESFLRKGQMIDQIIMGVTYKEWTSCRQQSQSQQQ